MKRFLPAILTLLLAVTLVLLYQSRQTITDLEKELATIKAASEKPSPRTTPGGTRPAAPSSPSVAVTSNPPDDPASTEKKENGKEKEKPEKSNDTADLLLGGAGEKEVAARSKARIALLRDRLKLRPDQLAALEKSATERNDAILAAFERFRQNKGTPPDLGMMMDWILGNHDLPVQSLLDADQAQSYKGMTETERTGRVEGMVNMEMLELQSQSGLQLTEQQKDQVFAALTGIAAAEDALGPSYYADDGQFMARVDDSLARRRAALAAILDETMMQNHDRTIAQDRQQIIDLTSSGSKKVP